MGLQPESSVTIEPANAPAVTPALSPVPDSTKAGWQQPSLASLFQQLKASPAGLSSVEAQKRLAATGPNEPAPTHRTSLPVQILLLFANPLVGILLFASFVSAIVGDPINASIIMIIVVLSVTLNFYQSYRSQQAAERLRAQVTPTATVLRDGAWKGVPRRELVPGDMVRLSAGDLVPADARLMTSGTCTFSRRP